MSYNALLSTLVACGEKELALSYFDVLMGAGSECKPDSKTYELAIEACGESDTDRALGLWDDMQALAQNPV